MAANQNPETIKMLDNALMILDALRVGSKKLGVNEIAKQCGINPSTAFRILKTLEVNGWVFQCGDGKYISGQKLSFVLSSDNLYLALKEVALPIMEKRTAEFGCAMNLMVRDGVNCYILQQSKVNDLFDFVPRLYAPLPIYACACGKILMSELPIAVADDIIQSCNMVKFTPNTLSDPEAFWQEIRTVAKQGYAVDDRELSRNGSCIAVPVSNHEGTIIAGISFSGFVDVSDVSELHTYLPALREASSEVTEKLYHCWQR